MKLHNLAKIVVVLVVLVVPKKVVGQVSILTAEEIQQYQDDLGIVLTEDEKTAIATIVKPVGTLPQWRIDANNRIEAHRKADLTIEVEDVLGNTIEGAVVKVELKKNAFKFGGVVRAEDITDAKGKLTGTNTTDYWKQLVSNLFNAVGTGNNFKPKLGALHQYLPNLLVWTSENNIDVRGHLLMWPGTGSLVDLDDSDAVVGADYGSHLSKGTASPFGYFDVLGAVNTYKNSARLQADKDALELVVDNEIRTWSSIWNVYEWDVINETISNTLLQEILGYDQMAEWLKIAENNMVNPDCKLLINEFQIISARSEELDSDSYSNRKATYMSRIDQVIADGGRLDRIGFQNRYKFEHPNPETTYSRLLDFSSQYNLEMVGTEFEIVDNTNINFYPYDFTETERAQITEETMTSYYSHPLTTGLFAWTFMDATDEKAIAYYDGTMKLNGLVWYYLHRIRYVTNEQLISDVNGDCAQISAFKGDYVITVDYDGKKYQRELALTSDNNGSVFILDEASALGLEDHQLYNDTQVYPNPASHEINIEAPSKIDLLKLYSSTGHLLNEQKEFNKIMDVSGISNGLYFLNLTFENGSEINKKVFIKN